MGDDVQVGVRGGDGGLGGGVSVGVSLGVSLGVCSVAALPPSSSLLGSQSEIWESYYLNYQLSS